MYSYDSLIDDFEDGTIYKGYGLVPDHGLSEMGKYGLQHRHDRPPRDAVRDPSYNGQGVPFTYPLNWKLR